MLCEWLGHSDRIDHDLGIRKQSASDRVGVRAESEQRGRSAKALAEIWKWRDPDSATNDHGISRVVWESMPERAEDSDPITGIEPRQRLGSLADRINEKAQLAGSRHTEAHWPWQQKRLRAKHEELARDSRIELASLNMEKAVWPDCLVASHAKVRELCIHAA
jgi:hypothetical protein